MKKIIIIVVIILILITAGVFFNIIPLEIVSGGMYHTGFGMNDVNNCETDHKGESSLYWYGNVDKDYSELFFVPSNNAPLVTSMKRGQGERSITVVCYGNIGTPAINNPWNPDYGWYEVSVKYDQLGKWKSVINTKDNQVDEDIVSFVDGDRTKQHYNKKQGYAWGDIYWLHYLNPISFTLRGSHVGIIRVRQYTELSSAFGILRETHVTSEDYTFMISGKGNVDIVGTKTRYIEGIDTVQFRVDTGYSGYTQGGEYIGRGWILKVYDNYGNLKKQWEIDDDKSNTRYSKNLEPLDYPIPEGSFNPSGSNTWRAVLTNTLFNQDDETFFAISQQALLEAPDIKPIDFGEDEYRLGEYVSVFLEGIPNPDGRNNIDGFLVNILYGTDGTDYVEDYHNKYISSTGNKATVSFRASKGDTYITVEAWAFDAPESQGGIMSEKSQGSVWIKDKQSAPIVIDYLSLIIAIAIFIVFLLLGIFAKNLPIPIRVALVILGAVLAYLAWWLIP